MSDGFMTLAMAIAIAGEGVLITQVRHGVGRHTGDVDLVVDYPIAMKMSFVSQPLFLSALCLVKLAVGSSLLRIASKKLYKSMIIGIMVFMTAYTIACIFTIVFQCTDVRIFWDFNVDSTCWDIETIKSLAYANSSVNILTDLLFGIAIPAPMLWTLNVPTRVRISLMIILGLGVFACAAACVKVYYVVTAYGKTFDPLWDSRNIQMWTVIEANVGVIAGSLPTLRPLFKDFLGSIYGKGSKAPTGNTYYGRGEGNRAPRPRKDKTGDGYEMGTYASRPVGSTTVMAGGGADDSDESLYKTGLRDGPERQGIKKTTVTTIMYSQNQKDGPGK
ncbi:hypothetical protein KHU50_005228 [Colletotrichum sp. SAR 10_65]|nr:hypothetical protein KHU50_005228 [Colletotrichum sp. SAR 10_65]KAI8215801.1 hypothetical protein K4K52_000054 [Colletotrichum sp. SAR 10_76]KAJ5001584.1 hypothetical protein K4K48_001221 [Colletotrichum sp. SAR 10_66]